MPDLIVRSRRVVLPEGPSPRAIHITGGTVERIADYDDLPAGAAVDDHGDDCILAGIVDSHVHVNEPGRTEWEGFETATRAAVAGGVTTIVDMPLNSIPPTTSVAALREKVDVIDSKCRCDVGLWGGAVPGNASELTAMLAAGALGFKCFLVDSGVPEFGHLDAGGLRDAMFALRDSGAPLLVHAELPGPIEAARVTLGDDAASYARFLASRPNEAEDEAIALVCAVARESGAWAHIVHLSSASAVEILRRAQDDGVKVTAETTPHYLFFAAETVPDAATQFKCAPPIRDGANRERLWDALRAGVITAIVSDHSPCTPELKHLADGDFDRGWGGIASLQFALPVVWTEAQKRGFTLEQISRLMSEGPAKLAGISDRKGRLAAGLDADLVVFDPDAALHVEPSMIEHRHKITPYEGHVLSGNVKTTYLRGRKVWENGAHIGEPIGKWMRGRAT